MPRGGGGAAGVVSCQEAAPRRRVSSSRPRRRRSCRRRARAAAGEATPALGQAERESRSAGGADRAGRAPREKVGAGWRRAGCAAGPGPRGARGGRGLGADSSRRAGEEVGPRPLPASLSDCPAGGRWRARAGPGRCPREAALAEARGQDPPLGHPLWAPPRRLGADRPSRAGVLGAASAPPPYGAGRAGAGPPRGDSSASAPALRRCSEKGRGVGRPVGPFPPEAGCGRRCEGLTPAAA